MVMNVVDPNGRFSRDHQSLENLCRRRETQIAHPDSSGSRAACIGRGQRGQSVVAETRERREEKTKLGSIYF